MGFPGLPVMGSIGVSVPSYRVSALFVTQSVLGSQEGTTCCGCAPTGKRSTTFIEARSITHTSFERRLGT